ncbi:apiosidase-like domain-containing protein [Paenibacillus kandeliae]|uniref:apiosidase-like domain-containing protein n=1 Tax=Paenibacillus kandeliae TaxID=3231269 RepID=UPI003459C31A
MVINNRTDASPSSAKLPSLRVSSDGHFLTTADDQPFFWLADTAWELLHRLNREETELYLRTRAEQGFNVIQTVLLAERDGLHTPNAYGRLPLHLDENGEPNVRQPDTDGDYSYWHHVDAVLELASSYGLYVALLPTWGDKFHQAGGAGPEIFTPELAYVYGQWLHQRYGQHSHLIWVLGGDRALQTRRHFDVIHQMAEGLRSNPDTTEFAIQEKAEPSTSQLITFHPKGGVSSSLYVHDEKWLDFHMIQSSHGAGVRDNYRLVQHDYDLQPTRPTLDSEPCYEDIPIDFRAENGYFDEADVRQAAYYAVFSGACGHTYGHHSVWSMYTGPDDLAWSSEHEGYFIMPWQQALQRPGAWQMRHARHLLEQVEWKTAQPAQQILHNPPAGSNYPVALKGKNYIFVYCPHGLYVKVKADHLPPQQVQARWYCPRSGTFQELLEPAQQRESYVEWKAPSSGRGNDWVLCLTWMT